VCAVLWATAGGPLAGEFSRPAAGSAGLRAAGHDQRMAAGLPKWAEREPRRRARPGPGPAWPWRGKPVASHGASEPELSASGVPALAAGRTARAGWQANLDPGLRGAAFCAAALSPCSGFELEGDLGRQRQLAWSARRPCVLMSSSRCATRWRAALDSRKPGGVAHGQRGAGSACALAAQARTARRGWRGPSSQRNLVCRKQVVLERREGQLRLVRQPPALTNGCGGSFPSTDRGGVGAHGAPHTIGGR